jgi:hypothetical protein
MRDNRLRVFAINDAETPDIGTNLLRKVAVPDGGGGEKDHMSHWLQHVYLLGSQAPITFDLLFIDIRFQAPYEAYAPKYGIDEHNPMGLLHALTFASRQDPSRAPLVWGYHSAEPGAVCEDPIAIIAFSLLAALEQRGASGDILVGENTWKWDDYSIKKYPRNAVTHFSEAIRYLPQGEADVIWKDMVRRYRNKLLHYVKKGKAFIEYDDITSAYCLARSNTESDRVKLAKLSLRFTGPSKSAWSKDILLQSLFADELIYREDEWPKEKMNCLTEYLASLERLSVSKPTEYWVEKIDLVLTGSGASRLTGFRPKGEKLRIGVMAILCWWLKEKSMRSPSVTVDQLLIDLGYPNSPMPLTNCVEQLLGFDRLGSFLDFLDATETLLGPPYYELGQYWWTEKLKCPLDRAPRCIQ